MLRRIADSLFWSARYEAPSEPSILQFFVLDRDNPSSIRSCIEAARENARTLRHSISSELWVDLNGLFLDARRWSRDDLEVAGVLGFFAELRDRFYRLAGITHGTLPRDLGFEFVSLGTMLERADNVTRLLDVKYHVLLPEIGDVGGPIDLHQWAAVLRTASGLEAYRKAYGNAMRIDRVVELLLFDRRFPRSARFCVDRLAAALRRIAGDGADGACAAVEPLAGRLRDETAPAAIAAGLHEFLVGVQEECTRLSEVIFDEYLRFE